MKSVMISIQPKWCELIASGKKTVEVRKTRPKIEVPFKCYIYCTKAKETLIDVLKDGDEAYGYTYHGKTKFIKGTEGSVCDMYGKRQKVIGEFVCDKIIPLTLMKSGGYFIPEQKEGRYIACMTVAEAREYGKGKSLYAWHISDLVIYEKPRGLREFHSPCEDAKNCLNINFREAGSCLDKCFDCGNNIKRPPQSWCYVEGE